VAALGVQRIGRDDRAGDVHMLQQHGEPGNLVRLGPDPDLAQDGAVSMIEGSQQVITGFSAAGRAS
jgi:uncharacterized protein YciI